MAWSGERHEPASTSSSPCAATPASVRTAGLDDATVLRLAAASRSWSPPSHAAVAQYDAVRAEFADLLDLDEQAQIDAMQAGFVNFYADDAVNPYVALAARGPWVVTLKGAVIHDSGGYGMLGFGHTPQAVIEAMAKPQVMANVMTAEPLAAALRERALRARDRPHPRRLPLRALPVPEFGLRVGVAGRPHRRRQRQDPRPIRAAATPASTIKRIAVKGAFHGRTERPALYSDSTRKTYAQHLASYPRRDTA